MGIFSINACGFSTKSSLLDDIFLYLCEHVFVCLSLLVRPFFAPGRDQYYSSLFFVGLLFQEHPKAQSGS